MAQPEPAPRSLKIVAALFILAGITSVIDVIIGVTQGALNLNFGILALCAGIGLLRLSRGWRTCALVLLWSALISLPLITMVFLFVAPAVNYTFLGRNVGEAPRGIGVGLAAVLFALQLWEYRVLTRPDIRRLFGLSA